MNMQAINAHPQGLATSVSPQRGASLASALVKARSRLTGIVLKEGRATMGGAGNYSYVGHEDVVRYGRDALLSEGLALVEISSEFLRNETYESRKGNAVVSVWRGQFALLHESGDKLGLSYDCMTQVSDKGGFVASTALDRTAILRVLQLAGSDYVDVPQREDPEHNSNNQPEAPAQQQAQQKALQGQQAAQTKLAVQKAWAAELTEHESFLEALEYDTQLVQWGVALHTHPADPNAKLSAWKAFGTRCAQTGLDPASIKAGIVAAVKKGA